MSIEWEKKEELARKRLEKEFGVQLRRREVP